MAKTNFDIFNPPVSQVVKGTKGKVILIHSNKRKLGKTLVGTQLNKPHYLRFEQGINAISGVPYSALTGWKDFKQVNKQLTAPETLEKAQEQIETVIIDTADVAIKWCQFYVCAQGKVTRLNDGNNGYGLWSEYENEWFKELNKLINAGYCLYIIAHSEFDKDLGKFVPKGDKRTMDLLCDAADFIGYVESNGVDEEGKEIPSSCYFVETDDFVAGSRYEFMPPKLEVFSAENLQNAIQEAIDKKEEKDGVGGVTFKELQEKESKEETYTYDEIIDILGPMTRSLYEADQERTIEIVEEHLGKESSISQATKQQLPQLEMILFDFRAMADELGVEV